MPGKQNKNKFLTICGMLHPNRNYRVLTSFPFVCVPVCLAVVCYYGLDCGT